MTLSAFAIGAISQFQLQLFASHDRCQGQQEPSELGPVEEALACAAGRRCSRQTRTASSKNHLSRCLVLHSLQKAWLVPGALQVPVLRLTGGACLACQQVQVKIARKQTGNARNVELTGCLDQFLLLLSFPLFFLKPGLNRIELAATNNVGLSHATPRAPFLRCSEPSRHTCGRRTRRIPKHDAVTPAFEGHGLNV